MKRFFAAAVCAALGAALLAGCAETAIDTGNKVVSSAQSYLKSETGFDGNVSKAIENAGSYIQSELGLNNSANQVLEGNWKSAEGQTEDWEWTFDGSNVCKLTSAAEGFSSEGTYSVNESEATVEIALNSWGKAETFAYKLQRTLSDDNLTLTSDSKTYSLTKKR